MDRIKFYFKLIVGFIVVYMIIKLFFICPYRINGNSMYPTLENRNTMIFTFIQKYGLRIPFYDQALFTYDVPRRNDIITFMYEGTIMVSRVIGLPGETIEVRGTEVYINGDILEEDENIVWQDGGLYDFGPLTIPSDSVFVMGDNRDHSRDSRFYEEPTIKIKSILGKSFYIFSKKYN